MSIWQFQERLSNRLFRWAYASMVVGAGLLPAGGFRRGFGAQAVGWGAIDAAIALFGLQSARARQRRLEDPDAPDVQAREARNLRLLLWANTGLDMLYMLGGWMWARRKRDDAFGRGTGWGVVVQGAFLFVFDLVHALHLMRQKGGLADVSRLRK